MEWVWSGVSVEWVWSGVSVEWVWSGVSVEWDGRGVGWGEWGVNTTMLSTTSLHSAVVYAGRHMPHPSCTSVGEFPCCSR